MILKIVKISRSDRISKNLNKYTSVGLMTTQYPNQWINGFSNKENASWKVGDEVEVEVVTNGQYLNFEMPKDAKKEDKWENHEKRIKALEDMMIQG